MTGRSISFSRNCTSTSLKKKYAQGDDTLYKLYAAKIFLGVVNIAVVAATTFTYSAPLILRLTGNVGLSSAVRVAGSRAMFIVATRILFMSAGGWITVITFGIQILIWVFNKDDLQIWCSLCIFGVNAGADEAYKSSKQQLAALDKVLISLSMGEEKESEVKPPAYPTLEEMLNHD